MNFRPRHILVLLGLVASCSGERLPTSDGDAPQDAYSKTTELGPLRATVSLTPKSPVVGDIMTLKLEVVAKRGIKLEMPPGDVLGRFEVTDTSRSDTLDPAGDRVVLSTYALRPPMSGKHRIPGLLVEFTDERQATTATETESRELITEEISFEVRSVLTDSKTIELRPPQTSMEAPRELTFLGRHWPWISGAGLGVLATALLLVAWLKRRAPTPVDPYRVAIDKLHSLESQGLPEEDRCDDWYVELSAIVRAYIEERFSIRAPELTTEEFLVAAKRAGKLPVEHQRPLTQFLEDCDRVKFAAHHPSHAECNDSLAIARDFLEQTRPSQQDDAITPSGSPSDHDQKNTTSRGQANAGSRVA